MTPRRQDRFAARLAGQRLLVAWLFSRLLLGLGPGTERPTQRLRLELHAVAAAQEEVRFVENAVRESLRTLGYQTPDAEAAGAEQALVVRSAAHPEHAVLALTESGRIRLDTIRIAGASSPGSDHEADQALCNALAAFRDELEKRGVRTTRVSHLPAGLSPVIRRELKKRSSTMTTAEIRKLQR